MSKDVRVEKCEPIFEWIKAEFRRSLRFPTNREIVAAGLESSTSQASVRLKQMAELGWIEPDKRESYTYYRIAGAKVVYLDKAQMELAKFVHEEGYG